MTENFQKEFDALPEHHKEELAAAMVILEALKIEDKEQRVDLVTTAIRWHRTCWALGLVNQIGEKATAVAKDSKLPLPIVLSMAIAVVAEALAEKANELGPRVGHLIELIPDRPLSFKKETQQ